MSQANSQEPRIRWGIDVIAIIAACVALYLSWQANHMAREANEIAKQGNLLAQKSNEIALSSIGPDPKLVKGNALDARWIYGCQDAESSEYRLSTSAINQMTFANDGGRSVALQDVALAGGSGEWSVWAFNNGNEVYLPVAIEPGSSLQLTFVGQSELKSDSKSTIEEAYQKEHAEAALLRWTFSFSDGKTLLWQMQTYPSSPGLDFTGKCPSVAVFASD